MWLEEMGVAERLVFYVFCAVAALNLVLALAVLSLGCIYKVNTPGASLDFYIAIGSMAMMVSALIQAADPEWGGMDQLEALCKFYPSILTFGLLWFIAGLLLKAAATHSYFAHHTGDRVLAHEWKPNFWMIILMILDAVLVMVWLLKYEPELAARDRDGERLDPKQLQYEPDLHMYTCEGERMELFEVIIAAVHAALLLIAGVIVWTAVYHSRRTPAGTETNLLSAAIYNTIFATVAATIAYFYYDGSKSSIVAIVGGAIFYVIFVTLLLLLMMKIIAARRLRNSKGSDQVYDKVDDDRAIYRQGYKNASYVYGTRL